MAAIAATAASVGIIGTAVGILTSFQGCSCGNGDAGLAKSVAEGMAPTALGLLLAILASWSYRYLCVQLESVDAEMRAASLELANFLRHCDRVDR
jgi:biopolymer transport protein ExbB/TolQ